METFDSIQPFKYIGKVFKIFGVWNTEECWTFTKILHFTLCPGIFIVLYYILMTIELLNAKNIDEMTERLYINFTMVALVIKLANFIVKRKKFTKFINDIKTCQIKSKNQEEIALVENVFSNFNKLASISALSAVGAVVGAWIDSVLSIPKHTPYPAWFPFDWRKGSIYFWIPFTFEVLGSSCSAIINTNFDFIHGYLFLQISIYYRLISMRLKAIGHDRFQDGFRISSNEYIEELRKSIEMHKFVTNLAECVQDLWTVSIFVQVGASGTVICFTAFQLTVVSPITETGLFCAYTCFMAAMLIQILFPCYYGNEMTVASEQVLNAVYSSNWTEMSREYKQLMFCFMESLKQPKVSMAAGFFQVGLQTMASVLRCAYSLFTFFMNMKN